MSIVPTLLEKPVVLLDGGLGTTLEDQYGIVTSPDTPLWSSHLLISSPQTLKQVHSAFAKAGADIIITATYQASFTGFSNTRINSQNISRTDAERYMLSAVSIARSSFQSKPGIVALSLGAYGASMVPSTEYSGEYGSMTESDLESFHRDRLSLFLNELGVWADVDCLAFETLPRLNEIRAVRRVASLDPRTRIKPHWISLVFPGADDRLPDGSSIPEVIDALLSTEHASSPFAIGINCTKIRKLPHLILQFERAILDAGYSFPTLVVYPDGTATEVYDSKLQKWVEADAVSSGAQTPWDEEMARIVGEVQSRRRWRSIIVGGCCKTSPSHIANLHRRLEPRT